MSIVLRRVFDLVLALISLALAGCDRCGDPVKFNAPTFPKVCHGVPTGT